MMLKIGILVLLVALAGCDGAWNNPHRSRASDANVAYSSFSGPPKTLDPAKSYSADEWRFVGQIYETPYQYDYLLRPYTLVPLLATEMPRITYLDKNNQVVSSDGEVAYSVYHITIKPHINYQPHPCFAKNARREYRYHRLTEHDLGLVENLYDFPVVSTRELVAEDFVYQIKRLADPRLNSPIYGVMSHYVVGMQEFHDKILKMQQHPTWLDLRKIPLVGVQAIDRYQYQIKLKGKYPQFRFWLAMPFFTAIPWEADLFYSQQGMIDRNITFDWQPIGTGAFYLSENNPNQRMVLKRNTFFHGEFFPKSSADKQDIASGYLINAGKKLPLLEELVFDLEKETIPRWNKFLQGYYDSSGVSSDSFDQAIHIGGAGAVSLTPEMQQLGIRLQTVVSPSIYYLGFNMLDPVVGGNSERARKLRQAISIAVDFREYIAIFNNDRGIVAQGPIPPGIFGRTNDNNSVANQPLEHAKKLLLEAGYPEGRDAKSGQPLVLNYDVASSSGPDDKARFDWMRKQFGKLNIQLNIRGTDYNRFQEKMRVGIEQIFMLGWNADYPDPENFLFLLYGKNGKVKYGGENAANYDNPEFDQLFLQMKNMENTPERQAIITRMTTILREDAPWLFGFFPKDFVLDHQWVSPMKLSAMSNNNLKYMQVDASKRAKMIALWNAPHIWPIFVLLILLLLLVVPVIISYIHRERAALKKES